MALLLKLTLGYFVNHFDSAHVHIWSRSISNGCARGSSRPLMDFYFACFFIPLPGEEQHHLHPLTLFFPPTSSRRRLFDAAAPVYNFGFRTRERKKTAGHREKIAAGLQFNFFFCYFFSAFFFQKCFNLRHAKRL